VRTLLSVATSLLAASLLAVPAAAVVLVVNPIRATWSNVTTQSANTLPAFTGNNSANALLSYGTNLGSGRSGYRFEAPATGVTANFNLDNIPVTLTMGTFTHINRPITSNTSITGARLTLAYTLTLGGQAVGNFTTVYQMVHEETPNNPVGGTCLYGGANNQGVNINGCADRVTFNLLSGGSQSFMQGRNQYVFNITGFQTTAGTVTNFLTQENALNPITLRGSIQGFDPVPEPSTWLQLVAGFAAIGLIVRKRTVAA